MASLERGFKRITLVVSVGLFSIGIYIATIISINPGLYDLNKKRIEEDHFIMVPFTTEETPGEYKKFYIFSKKRVKAEKFEDAVDAYIKTKEQTEEFVILPEGLQARIHLFPLWISDILYVGYKSIIAVFCIALIPWGIFYLLCWIVRGFQG